MKFAELLKVTREKREISIDKLHSNTGIPPATLYAYEAGRRGVPRDKADLIRDQLCLDKAERAEFDAAWTEALQIRAQAPFSEKFGSNTTALSLGDLTYQPFSGWPNGFMNKFLKELLDPARIRIDVREDDPEKFDVEDRIRLIEDKEANLLINLQTPMRMRKLHFLPTPIRVSLNGVILQQEDEDIRSARSVLITEKAKLEKPRNSGPPFKPVAIRNEVGQIFLLETLGVANIGMEEVDTLDPSSLAKLLSPDKRLMLVCDEVTALAVVGSMKGPATFVMPPSTDESVLHFEDRRRIPIHYLGFAVSRENTELADYLAETIENFLSTEIEAAAELLQTAYDDLVTIAKRSFNHSNFMYSGGIRRVMNPLRRADKKRTEIESILTQQIVAALLQQNARAFAKRCLSISRRSIAELPDHLSGWRHALQRARERVLILEARDRAVVREIIVSAVKTVLGMDPTDNLDQSYHRYFILAKDEDHWADFKELLERELDIVFPMSFFPRDLDQQARRQTDSKKGNSKTNPFLSFEFFVSAVQRTMEENTELARIISVKCIDTSNLQYSEAPKSDLTQLPAASWEKPYTELWQEYCAFRGDKKKLSQPRRTLRLMAFSLGQAVGFLTAVLKPFKDREENEHPGFQVMELFVTDVMTKNGISRRMIRALIDTVQMVKPDKASPEWECVYIWCEAGLESRDKALERSGFTKTQNNRYFFYRLYGLENLELASLELH